MGKAIFGGKLSVAHNILGDAICLCFFPDTFEVEINGKLIFSKRQLGHYPERDEIVEITKWGNKVEKKALIFKQRALLLLSGTMASN